MSIMHLYNTFVNKRKQDGMSPDTSINFDLKSLELTSASFSLSKDPDGTDNICWIVFSMTQGQKYTIKSSVATQSGDIQLYDSNNILIAENSKLGGKDIKALEFTPEKTFFYYIRIASSAGDSNSTVDITPKPPKCMKSDNEYKTVPGIDKDTKRPIRYNSLMDAGTLGPVSIPGCYLREHFYEQKVYAETGQKFKEYNIETDNIKDYTTNIDKYGCILPRYRDTGFGYNGKCFLIDTNYKPKEASISFLARLFLDYRRYSMIVNLKDLINIFFSGHGGDSIYINNKNVLSIPPNNITFDDIYYINKGEYRNEKLFFSVVVSIDNVNNAKLYVNGKLLFEGLVEKYSPSIPYNKYNANGISIYEKEDTEDIYYSPFSNLYVFNRVLKPSEVTTLNNENIKRIKNMKEQA